MSLITRQGKGLKLTIQEMDGNLLYLEQLAQQGGGIEGTNYVFVQANGTDLENGQELLAAYEKAKTMSPSSSNRITVVAAPGNYDFDGSFIMDTEFIDLVSLDGNRSIINTSPNFEFFRFSDRAGEWTYNDETLSAHQISDGGNDMYDDANRLFADDNLIFYTHTQLDDDPSAGIPIEDFIIDGEVVSGEDANMFGPSASYFTNLYPGLFVMCAKNTQIDQFKIDGGIGADGNGIVDNYNFQVGAYRVFVKRVWGAGSDPSINQIIIVNTTSNNIVQTIDETRQDDLHSLDGLISAGVTEINYLLVASEKGLELPKKIVEEIVIQFINILTSSSDINQLLSNLNANYQNIVDTTVSYLFPIKITADNVYLKGVDNRLKSIYIGNNLPNVKIENCKGGEKCFNVDLLFREEIQEEINVLNNQYFSLFHSGTLIYNESTYDEENALDFVDALDGQIGANVLYTPLIMRDVVNNDYYIVKFYSWTQGGNGGGFSYTRQLITEEGDAPIISFTKTDYGSEVDVISEGVLEITRGDNGPIFNIVEEEESNGVNPEGTEWFITDGYEFTPEQDAELDAIQLQIDNLYEELDLPVELSSEFINCEGGSYSFGSFTQEEYNELGLDLIVSGRFVDCKSGFESFGNYGIASGTFTNCATTAGSSFGFNGVASGTFINCVGRFNSFGTFGTASGTFIDCESNFQSFGFNGVASGIFTNCVSDGNSFGYDGTASGTFTNCVSEGGSFGRFGTASGTFINCVGKESSFGNNGTASGRFTNCIGGTNSFGGFGTLSGKLYYCRLTSGTFPAVSGGGRTRLCIDGNDEQNNQG